jgi:hypothetical protein
VLSVVAQQVLEIQLAVKAKVKTFFFEGSELKLRPTCNGEITVLTHIRNISKSHLPGLPLGA